MVESDLRTMVLNSLRAKGYFADVIESNKLAGKPDIYAGKKDRSLWIEVKYRENPPTEGGLLSHKFSDVQIETMSQMDAAGIEVYGLIGVGPKKGMKLYKVKVHDMKNIIVGDPRLEEIKFGEW